MHVTVTLSARLARLPASPAQLRLRWAQLPGAAVSWLPDCAHALPAGAHTWEPSGAQELPSGVATPAEARSRVEVEAFLASA